MKILPSILFQLENLKNYMQGREEYMNVVPLQRQEPQQSIEDQIFTHWKTVLGYKRARMDQKRLKVIRDRIKDGYSLEDLTDAINGCFLSPFHQGDNDRGTRYDDIELICRNASNVDKFIAIYEEGQQRLSARESRTTPPERNSRCSTEDALRRLAEMKRILR